MRAEDRALVPPRTRSKDESAWLPGLVIISCVCFNFVLCVINTHVTPISIPDIIACEILLNGAAALYGFMKVDRARLYWVGVLLLQLAWIAVLSMAKQELLFKPLRDVLIMPVFIALGLSSSRLNVDKTLIVLGLLVLTMGLLEGFFMQQFLAFADFRQYFEMKGLIDASKPNYLGVDLFASGIRPNSSFLIHIPGFHRISSIFLEPVSLGFFGFVYGLYFAATLSPDRRGVCSVGLLIAFASIVLSDARMACGSLVLILALRPLLSRIDHRFSAMVFPAVLGAAYVIFTSGLAGHTGDGIGARIHGTMTMLSGMDVDILLGAAPFDKFTGDSGLAQLLSTQGLFGFLLYWLPPIFFMRRISRAGRIYLFGVAIFLSFGFLLSAAIFSIKTAALLWFLYGYLIVSERKDVCATADVDIDRATRSETSLTVTVS